MAAVTSCLAADLPPHLCACMHPSTSIGHAPPNVLYLQADKQLHTSDAATPLIVSEAASVYVPSPSNIVQCARYPVAYLLLLQTHDWIRTTLSAAGLGRAGGGL
jgi:hypothetical protein